MRGAGKWALGLGLLVWSGCSRKPQNEQMAALDQMLETGVLTRAEYDAKKTIIEGSRDTLQAIENAYKAGVLTRSEYEAKRAAILAPAAPLDAGAGAAVMPASAPPAAVQESSYRAPAPAPPQAPRSDVPAVQPLAVQQPAAQQPAPAPPTAGGRANYLVLKKITVMDQNGFERPIPSATLLLPADWQSQGATQWNTRDACNTIQTTLRASGSDGRAYEIFPIYSWAWADDPGPLRLANQQKAQFGTKGCDVMPPMSAADFIRRNLPRLRPGAQLVAIEPMPKYLEIMQRQARQSEQQALQYRLQQRIRPDVARARIRYSVNGQPMEEWLAATTITTGTLGPSMNVQTGQMFQAFTYACTATLVGARAPQGQLDSSERFFELITSTIRIDPSWQARVNQTAGNIAAIEQKGVRDRVAINTQTARDIDQIRREGYANQQASEDRVFGNISDTTRGVQGFRNPTSGETYELSNLYGQAWVNNRGEFFLTDPGGNDPNLVLKNSTWTALEPVKR